MINEKPKNAKTTAFSDFIRNANSAQRKRVYNAVIEQSSEIQNALAKRVMEKRGKCA